MRRLFLLGLVAACSAAGQPLAVEGGVQFSLRDSLAKSVAVVGDFNGWSKEETPMAKGKDGIWSAVRKLRAGIYQYKFVVDGSRYVLDPGNPATVDNYNKSAKNSAFVSTDENVILLTAEAPTLKVNPTDTYPSAPGRKPVYLNIIWHQHQPLYANPETDQLTGPWVRTHATKDYYDMAAMLRSYPNVHCNINLTSSLLLQLQEYYVDRMGPFVHTRTNSIDVRRFMKQWGGKTDPWIDLALKPTSTFGAAEKDLLYRNAWNAFGIGEVMIERFPEYRALRSKLPSEGRAPDGLFSEKEMREIKFWFYLAHFDPDFLAGPVKLTDGSVCDLSDLVQLRADKKYYLRKRVTEKVCQRMVAEAYKVMANIVPVHRAMRYVPERRTGQIDVITTPYYHPILPLIYDSDLAKTCQPTDTLPSRFSFPEDAEAQVKKAVRMFSRTFGGAPTGMWPGEGSVAQPVLSILRSNGILWTASDVKVLTRSDPPNQPNTSPYQFPAGDHPISLVFRDTELSDKIGFKYQEYTGEESAEDFVQSVLLHAPAKDQSDVLITVILDGENAWEWYRQDNDAKQFLHALYRKLSALYSQKRIITTTMAEYISGNPSRGVAAHPVESQPAMKSLWPGSWINANYDTWIGEWEENQAWEYLLKTRKDLAQSGVLRPDPDMPVPAEGTAASYAYRAWESMYAAEGSDWFWWYGDDQLAPGGDRPFDIAFLTHLRNVYKFAGLAGGQVQYPNFAPIIRDAVTLGRGPDPEVRGGGGTMGRSKTQLRTVLFVCDARGEEVPQRICIAGNLEGLGMWRPNLIAMRDDGREGDETAGDGLWTLRIDVPVGTEIQYKYTNSGNAGSWKPGEEFPVRHRTVAVSAGSSPMVIKDIFGKQ
jgi:alpha-amylase/alpha-mannosidase (GH57 family)